MRQKPPGTAGLPDLHGEAEMIEALKARVNADEALVRRGRFLSTTFLLEVG